MIVFLLFLFLFIPSLLQADTLRVALSGSDMASCGEPSHPCKSIQYTVNKAISGDLILVAGGSYTYSTAHDTCSSIIKDSAVVCYFNKELTIVGGYSTDNWVQSDPQNNLTVIDGQNYKRGLLFARTSPSAPAARLHLEGFTIQNGNVQGTPNGTGYSTFAFGGGMLVDDGLLSLRKIKFINNKVSGGNTTAETFGGGGGGGGLAIRLAGQVVLDQIHFESNEASGGSGTLRGGYGIGGGLFSHKANIYGNNLTFLNNVARGGNTNGNGIDQVGERSDALGGAAGLGEGSNVTIENIFASGNRSFGGNAVLNSGGGFGGAICIELAKVTIKGAEIRDNLAQGGNAANGWLGSGGGIKAMNSTVTIERSTIIKNTARGGNGTSGDKGAAGGGGVDVTWYYSTIKSILNMSNTIVAENSVEQGMGTTITGGGGGGLWIQATQADLKHLTVAGNRISESMQGQGILLIEVGNTPASATLAYSLVTNHSWNATAALHVKSTNTITLVNGRWSENLKNHNAGEANAGNFIGLGNMSTVSSIGYIAPGDPNYNYHLRHTSPVKDLGAGSSMPVDIDNDSREKPDLGADEYAPFPLQASSRDSALLLSWMIDPGLVSWLDHYELVVQCESGANPPEEIGCGQPLNLGTRNSLLLTGLTNYKFYTLSVTAKDQAGATLDISRIIRAFATDIHVFIPLIHK